MKNQIQTYSHFLLGLLLLFSGYTASADVVIGSGTNESQNVPIEPYYGYTYSQSIYTAGEINASGGITAIKWYWSGTSNGNNSDSVTIYLAHTTKSSFSANNDFVPDTAIAQYFKGIVTYPSAPGWMTITLDSTFNYNGVDNLLIATEEDRAGYNSSSDDFYCSQVSASRSIAFYSDVANPSPSIPTPAANSLYIGNYVPNITLVGITPSCPNPSMASVCHTSTTSVDITWTGTAANYVFEYGPTGFTPGTGTSSYVSTSSIPLSSLSPSSAYDYYIQGVCGVSDSSGMVGPFSFLTPCLSTTMPFVDSVENQTPSTSGIVGQCYIGIPTGMPNAYRWDISAAGTTPSSFTGATTANSGSQYFYTEASSGGTGSEAELYLPPIDFSASNQNVLSFYYHMHGSDMGSLYIERFDNCNWIAIDSLVGQQQASQSDPWIQKVISTPYTGEQQFRFRAVKGSSYKSDICIDDINFQNVPTCATIPPHVLIASDTIVCANTNFSLDLDTNLAASTAGIVYEWESSTDGVTYSLISGASTASYIANITVPTYFRVKIKCSVSGDSSVTAPVMVDLDSFYNCYCTSAANSTSDDDIGQFTIGSFANPAAAPTPQAGNSTATNTYTNFTSLGAQNLNSTTPLPFSVYQINSSTTQYNCYVGIYIDYNQDGVYDPATELFAHGPSNSSNSFTLTGNGTIPSTAMVGHTGLRVVLEESASQTTISPCGSYSWGETEDYLINIMHPPACTGTPTAGNATSTDTMVCPNEVYTLGLDTLLNSSGISHQWQVSTTSNTSGFSNISNATSTTFDTSQTVQTWYRCIVSCDSSGGVDTSSVIQINMDSFYGCYCNSQPNYGTYEDIGQFSLGAFTNPATTPSPQANNPVATEYYTDYTSLGPIQLVPNSPTPVSIYQISAAGQYNCYAAVYVDMNHNGSFDSTERVFGALSDTSNGYNPIGLIVIPPTAMHGITGMRVILDEGADSSTIDPCGTYYWGETEDYLVSIGCSSTINDLPDTSVCENPGITLDAGSGFSSYSWSTGDSTQTVDISTSGTYTVTAYDSSGCMNQETATIIAHPNPSPMLVGDTSFCEGTMLNLSYMDSSISSYTWSTGDSSSSVDVSAGGVYWIEVMDSNGCYGSDTTELTMINLPTATVISAVQSGTDPFTYSFSSNGSNVDTYTWDFGDGNTGNTSQPDNTFDSSGNYTITLIVSNDCGSDTATLTQWFGWPESIHTPGNEVFKLYPNPAKDHLIVKMLHTDKIQAINMVNSVGQRIEVRHTSTGSSEYQILLPEVPTGHYYLEVITEEGKFVQPFVLNR